MTCYSPEELADYAHGRVSPAKAQEVAAHLETCSQCEATVSALEREGDTLVQKLRQAGPQNPFLAEPECKQAVERLKASAGDAPGEVPPTIAAPKTAKPAAAPPLPRQIHEYRLLKKLGEGGMGAVYKALHTKLDKLVAIKVLLPNAINDPTRIACFEQEMKAIGKLENPHIVRAMDAGQVGDRHYLVMEFVEGLDLSELIRRNGPLRIADACELIREATLGLRAVEEHGLVHRDIKPSNLILNADGQVKILDLGLATLETARHDDSASRSRTVAGTPDYMAPEQAAGEVVDIRADIYSLGCSLYKLLTGEPPFAGPKYHGRLAKLTAHISIPVPPITGLRNDVPPKLAAVLDRMLAKDRAARFGTPRQLAEELQTYCAGSDLAGLYARATQQTERPTPQAKTPSLLPHPPREEPRVRADFAQGQDQAPSTKPAPGFDPYYKWLGIPPEEQPANHYRLLGLRLFEADRDVIQAAVDRHTIHLRTFALGKHQALSQKLLNHVHQAKTCLLDGQKKALYDAALREQIARRAEPSSDGKTPSPKTEAERTSDTGSASPTRQQENAWQFGTLPALDGAKRAGRGIRPPAMAIAGAAGAAAVLLLGITLIVRNRHGEELTRLTVPTGSQVSVEPGGNVTVTLPEETATREPDVPPRPLAGEGPEVRAVPPEPTQSQTPEPETGSREAPPDNSALRIPHSALPPPAAAVAPFDEKKAEEHQAAWAKYLDAPVKMTNSIGMKFVLIPPGEFTMGSTLEEVALAEKDRHHSQRAVPLFSNLPESEGPRHRVCLTKPYYLGVFETTWWHYQILMEKETMLDNDRAKRIVGDQDTANLPAVRVVHWDAACQYCQKLSNLPAEQSAHRTYRLPTEAEWEYACRAGTATRYYWGDDENGREAYGWFNDNSGGTVHPVGQKKPNAWGLYDMLGNASEFCSDYFAADYYSQSPAADPVGPSAGDHRVLRGGSWGLSFREARCGSRRFATPRLVNVTIGFRVLCEIAPPVARSESAVGHEAAGTPAAAVTGVDPSVAFIPGAGRQIVNPKDDSVLVFIPAGKFLAGEEKFEVNLPAYFLGLYEVTNSQYKRFIDATGHRSPDAWKGKDFPEGKADYPATRISWEDSKAYCKWAGLRLPTELEWEKGARGIDGRNYPWGNDWNPAKYCNHKTRGDAETCPVSRFPEGRSPWGVYQMCGNAWEWCEEFVDREAWDRYKQGDLRLPSTGTQRTTRGPNSDRGTPADTCWVPAAQRRRRGLVPNYLSTRGGFRVAKDATPEEVGRLVSGAAPASPVPY